MKRNIDEALQLAIVRHITQLELIEQDLLNEQLTTQLNELASIEDKLLVVRAAINCCLR